MLANIVQLDFSAQPGLRERVDAILADTNYEAELAKLSAFLDVSLCLLAHTIVKNIGSAHLRDYNIKQHILFGFVADSVHAMSHCTFSMDRWAGDIATRPK